jgi:oxygen-independent coproporphyrinogen-3 oxidase
MLVRAGQMIEQAGYRWIGMDQFALPDDSLAQAQVSGSLQRNIQGYTLHGDADVIGFGTSAISEVGPLYAQNHTSISQWQSAIADAELPLARGVELDFDDRVRRDLIRSLTCQHRVDLAELGERWQIDAAAYFSAELAALGPLADNGMLHTTETGIILTDEGRLVSRAVAMQFDRYLGGADRRQRLARIL